MRVYLQHPNVNWSLSDVFDGLQYGLIANGCTLVDRKEDADWIIVVNGNQHKPETLQAWKQFAPVAVLCTESPYDMELEIARVAVADAAWTHERLAVEQLRTVNPRVGYLPHAWHPERHTPGAGDDSVPAHDVVFVGSGFRDRIAWLNAIDWTGINLGLYGLWLDLGLKPQVMACVYPKVGEDDELTLEQQSVPNAKTVALYRRATIGLNLYRSKGSELRAVPQGENVRAESLNPRAYELAACGVFQLSSARVEVEEKFGKYVPTLKGDPKKDEWLIRRWLRPEFARPRKALALLSQRAVRKDTWTNRAATALAHLKAWSQVTV